MDPHDEFDPSEVFPATDTLKFLGIRMADGASAEEVARYVLKHREPIESHLAALDVVLAALDDVLPNDEPPPSM